MSSRWEFEKKFDVLRTKIRLSGLEDDEYKIIIFIENFILTYGQKAFLDTIDTLGPLDENDSIFIILEVMQTEIPIEKLMIYNVEY